VPRENGSAPYIKYQKIPNPATDAEAVTTKATNAQRSPRSSDLKTSGVQ
jgi:hypothetical protein